MSRNVRQEHPTTPVKVTKRRGSASSSSLDLSDEGGYSAVEDISDSDEDDDDDVKAAEEEHILSDELQHDVRNSPRPHKDEDDDDDDEDDDEDHEDEYEGDDDAEESGSWDGIVSESDEHEIEEQAPEPDDVVSQRRVRFDVPESDSDGDSTETDDDVDQTFFPDLFIDKSTLDPTFRREIEHDPDPYDSSNSDAFWDHYGTSGYFEDGTVDEIGSDFDCLLNAIEDDDSTPVATPMTSYDLSTAISTPAASPDEDEVSLDGYQTDGDTTDEEDPPERPLRRKTRREITEVDVSDSDVVTLVRPRRGQPRVGRFNLDRSSKKPIAIVNPRTGKMMIFTHQDMRGRGFDLSPEQSNFHYFDQTQSSPILSNPGNIMMSGMISSSTYGDYMNSHTAGPVEAWYSQTSDGNAMEEASDESDEIVDDEEKNLKLEDFITLDDHNDSSDDEKLVEDDDDIFQTPGRPTTSSSDVANLLDHFQHDVNIVGAFRRDQANHHLITRNKVTHDSLAFSGPYFEGTLRGIKDGRIATTNVPISPMRKQKRMPEMASSPLAQKRKASSQQQQMGHKRQRSVPDVDALNV
ncbi:hypothetical protein F4778DRAFT_733740 [Xylariomycetidae sp. FL2044]|nr:hypothetical protein F4778DRAFT_733740 [Xylariomycetidae sp. FL2044]